MPPPPHRRCQHPPPAADNPASQPSGTATTHDDLLLFSCCQRLSKLTPALTDLNPGSQPSRIKGQRGSQLAGTPHWLRKTPRPDPRPSRPPQYPYNPHTAHALAGFELRTLGRQSLHPATAASTLTTAKHVRRWSGRSATQPRIRPSHWVRTPYSQPPAPADHWLRHMTCPRNERKEREEGLPYKAAFVLCRTAYEDHGLRSTLHTQAVKSMQPPPPDTPAATN